MKGSFINATLLGMTATSANAGFVGMNVVPSTTVVGLDTFYVFRVFARFNSPNDTVLSFSGLNATPTGLCWHNDMLTGGQSSNVSGTWNPSLANPQTAGLDSWLTVGGVPGLGNSTSAPWFDQPCLPQGAGVFNSNPPNLQGRVNPGTLETLIGQFVMRNQIVVWTTNITLSFNQGLGTAGQFANSSFTLVPTPGGFAVLALAGLAGTRRRR